MLQKTVINEKGNIGIAIVVVIVSVLSGISMAAVAFRDTHAFRLQLDGFQQFHILRSEIGRGRLFTSYLESMESPQPHTTLPTRIVNVEFGNHRSVYRAKTKVDIHSTNVDTGYLIRTLITAVRGNQDTNEPDLQSPVIRYGENRIRSLQTLAIFHYFTDTDRGVNDVPGSIRFFREDIVRGRVHSNTDIWILDHSWPTFYGLVTTTQTIKVYPGGGTTYPRDRIFRGGLIENYPAISFDPSARLVRRHGIRPAGHRERDDAIAYVTVDGSTYNLMIGEVREVLGEWVEGYNKFTIYDSYPPYGEVGDSIGVNYITKVDTIWKHFPSGSLSNGSAFIPMELWISGTFGGKQTWASSHNIYLKDDLTYLRTIPGRPPDGGPAGRHPVNPTDYLGIISEESIYIQYGHKNPVDNIRYRPNTNSIYMYGAYCATGLGDNHWEDGIVSFQYHFPKGSTPDQRYNGFMYRKIDLHRFHYPTEEERAWPRGLDYPWYNPLWPEPGQIYGFPGFPATPNPHGVSTIVKLRGEIHLFGSIAQRRRGYVRRSGRPSFDTGMWDIDNNLRPETPPQYGSPAPEIGPSGYNKRYTYDTRFDRTSPPHFPLITFEGFETQELMDLGHITDYWALRDPPSNF